MVLGYVVFCKLCNLIDAAGNVVAGALAAFDKAVQNGLAVSGRDECRFFYAHGGGFVVVPKRIDVALRLASEISVACAASGVTTAIGVTRGDILQTDDAVEPNVAGRAINRAARIAYHRHAERMIGVEARAAKEAHEVHSDYKKVLGPYASITVKKDLLEVSWAQGSEWIQTLMPGAPPPATSYDSQDAHAIVYDIVDYSSLPDDQQVAIGERLTQLVKAAARDAKAHLGHDNWVWYAPTGDGGTVVFDAQQRSQSWTFATSLATSAGEAKVPLRIGIDTGQVFLRGERRLPVGRGVFRADHLSSAGKVAPFCIGNAYWLETLGEQERKGWRQVRDEELNAFHVDYGEPPPSNGSPTNGSPTAEGDNATATSGAGESTSGAPAASNLSSVAVPVGVDLPAEIDWRDVRAQIQPYVDGQAGVVHVVGAETAGLNVFADRFRTLLGEKGAIIVNLSPVNETVRSQRQVIETIVRKVGVPGHPQAPSEDLAGADDVGSAGDLGTDAGGLLEVPGWDSWQQMTRARQLKRLSSAVAELHDSGRRLAIFLTLADETDLDRSWPTKVIRWIWATLWPQLWDTCRPWETENGLLLVLLSPPSGGESLQPPLMPRPRRVHLPDVWKDVARRDALDDLIAIYMARLGASHDEAHGRAATLLQLTGCYPRDVYSWLDATLVDFQIG